ncbi:MULTISPECIES: LysR family transcriptional regulator [Novosphingobium]|uniref:LysR family transcriptional regulator n=1 Tax=Novosphingobium TaxID=165696 RepID=UPI0022F24FE1|nr:LysR family transcriptional regulator [Novosphingobium resinovorum]GLK43865.1 LysR family transcriptional regulator [Novosphingobium resinovorum]
MELRQIRYFKAVADASSFVRGAYYLNVAQPALSRSIAKLEDEVGQALFVRHSTGVSLTDAGERFYRRATGILDSVKQLVDEMATEDSDFTGSIALGAPQSIHAKLLLPVMAGFLARYPGCRVDLIQGSSSYLRDRIAAGDLDVALISNSASTSGVMMTPLVNENFCLVCPRERRGEFADTVSVPDLVGLPLVLVGYPQSTLAYLEAAYPEVTRKLVVRSEVNSSALVGDLVERGAGFGIAPSCVIGPERAERLSFVPIEGLQASWAIATQWNRQGLRAIREIHEMLLSLVADQVAAGEWPTARLPEAADTHRA